MRNERFPRDALRRVRGCALACALSLGFAGPPGIHADELSVAAASSLREALGAIASRHERLHPGLRVRLAFAASNVLAAQARAGAPIDVLVSADERLVDALEREGLVDSRSDVASNRLVVVARDPALVIEEPRALLAPSVRRIAIPEHAVPVGRYARQWLARHGLIEALDARIVRTEHARATLLAVDRGLADAAIVYATDARLARSARVAFEIPRAEQPRIAYVAAVLANRAQREAARAFVRFLRDADSTAILVRAGFQPPPGEAGGGAP